MTNMTFTKGVGSPVYMAPEILKEEKYKAAAGKRDRKLLQFINIGYDTMHLVMGYDGNRNKNVCDTGFENANAIIDRCATLYPGTPCA